MRTTTVHYGSRGYSRLLRDLRGAAGDMLLVCGPTPGVREKLVANVAADLGYSMYRVDLAKVVSKYIGETEKNLSGVLDAVDPGTAILFFDEADALFGKRSEVRNSHDRYANVETNYLLQRIQSFHGLSIIAANPDRIALRDSLQYLRAIIKPRWRRGPKE